VIDLLVFIRNGPKVEDIREGAVFNYYLKLCPDEGCPSNDYKTHVMFRIKKIDGVANGVFNLTLIDTSNNTLSRATYNPATHRGRIY
jgi:hypothetical protein